MILDETYNLLKSKYGDRFRDLTIEDARVGVFLTAVILSDGSCGAASTIVGPSLNCARENRDFGEFTPTRIRGRKVMDLLESDKGLKIMDSLKMAVLNAVSSGILSASRYKIVEDADPIDFIDLTPPKTITVVGAFQSYIRKIAATANTLYVLELDETTLHEDQKKFFVPADESARVLPISDSVIITGFTLVNNTIDGLLELVPPGAQVAVTGPSGSIIPDILFEHKVNIIGATRITNSQLLMEIAGEGGTGYHLFQYCAQKICILNEKQG